MQNNYFAQYARKTAAQVVEMKRCQKRYKLTKYAIFGRAKLMFGARYESQLVYISWGGRFHVASTLRLTTLRAQTLKPTLPQIAQRHPEVLEEIAP